MSIVPTGSLDKLIIRLPQTSEEITMRHILVQCALKIHSDHKSSAHSIKLHITSFTSFTSFTSITKTGKQHEDSMKSACKQKITMKGNPETSEWTWGLSARYLNVTSTMSHISLRRAVYNAAS